MFANPKSGICRVMAPAFTIPFKKRCRQGILTVVYSIHDLLIGFETLGSQPDFLLTEVDDLASSPCCKGAVGGGGSKISYLNCSNKRRVSSSITNECCPCLFSSWTSVRPSLSFVQQFLTELSLKMVSPYTQHKWRCALQTNQIIL